MNVDFSQQAGATPVAQPENPTPPAPQTVSVPAVSKPAGPTSIFGGSGGLVLGDKIPEFKEIVLPRLNISQILGKIQETFAHGALVYNQQIALFTPPIIDPKTKATITPATPPVILTVLGFRPTRFCEKVPGGGKGLIVDSEDAVRAAGGTTDYQEHQLKAKDGMKRFEPFADALVAIRRPDWMVDDDTVFNFPADGHKYALALWGMRGTAYTAAAKKVFFTARSVGCLKGGYPTVNFAVTTRLEDYPGGHSAWLPICIPGTKNTEKFMEFAASVLATPQMETDDQG